MEMLEYFDSENKKVIGITDRDTIHKNSLWHREVSVWVVNKKGEILLQRRSPLKKEAPNKYSVCAGHVGINEGPEMSAIRELEEETGISVKIEDLIYIDTFVNNKEGNKVFKYTYLVFSDKSIEDMKMQEEEVSELKYISFSELENLVIAQDESLTFSNKEYARIVLDFIKNKIIF